MHSTGGSCSRPPGPCPRCHPQCLGLGEGQGGLGSHQGGSAPSWDPLGSTVSCSPLCHVPRPAEPQGQCPPSPASGTGRLAWSLVPAGVARHLQARPSPEARGVGQHRKRSSPGELRAEGLSLSSALLVQSLVPSLPRSEDTVPAGRPAPAPRTHTVSLSRQVHDRTGIEGPHRPSSRSGLTRQGTCPSH